MKYYLDTNALINLYFRKKVNLNIYKKTYISMVVIAEIMKGGMLEKNYIERHKQLKFISENGININHKSFDSIIIKAFYGVEISTNRPMGSMFSHASSISFLETEKRYKAFMESDTCDAFFENYLNTSSLFSSNAGKIPIPIDINSEMVKIFYNDSFTTQNDALECEIPRFENKKQYEIEKEIKCKFVEEIIERLNSKLLSEAKTKHLFRTMKKKYDKSLDLFIKCKAKYIFNREILRNDNTDLLHLIYVNIKENDLFVTDDKKLRELIKSISNTSTINVNEYLEINDGYGT
jgi:hypothetical protein